MRASANNFRGQDVAERTHGAREGEEDQDGGGCLSKNHYKAKIFMKKISIPEAAVFDLGVDACRSRPFFLPCLGSNFRTSVLSLPKPS